VGDRNTMSRNTAQNGVEHEGLLRRHRRFRHYATGPRVYSKSSLHGRFGSGNASNLSDAEDAGGSRKVALKRNLKRGTLESGTWECCDVMLVALEAQRGRRSGCGLALKTNIPEQRHSRLP
jgi:hypothetical protein